MTYAVVGQCDGSPNNASTTVATTGTYSVSAGNTLLALCDYNTGGGANAVVSITDDSGGNDGWTEIGAGTYTDPFGLRAFILPLTVASASTTFTVTYTSNSFTPGIAVFEISGLDTTSPVIASRFTWFPHDGTTNTDAITTGNTAALSTQPDCVFGFATGAGSEVVPDAGTGYTGLTSVLAFSGSNQRARPEHKRVTSTSAVAATFTATNGFVDYNTAVIVLQEAAGQLAHPIANIDVGGWLPAPLRNLFTFTEKYDDPLWFSVDVSVEADVEDSPIATLTGDGVIEAATNGFHYQWRDSTGGVVMSDGLDYTYSEHAKPDGRDWIKLELAVHDATRAGAWFNVATGSIGTIDASVTAAITGPVDGWYRCSIMRNASTGGAPAQSFLYLRTADNDSGTYLGDGVSGAYFWGAQLEQASAMTAYQAVIGTSLHAYSEVNEAVANDNGYIYTQTVDDTCKLFLMQLPDPFAFTGHTLRFRGYADEGEAVEVGLYCAATLIATTTQILNGTPTTYSLDLSYAQANAISNYYNLRVWLTSRESGSPSPATFEVRITWIEFETPSGTARFYFDALNFGAAA